MKFLEGGKNVFWVAFALAACTLAMYARALGYAYVWDDLSYLERYSQYQGVAGAARALAEPFFLYPSYYRPLAMLSFVVSREPWAQHAINVLLHALNTVLVFLCARTLLPQRAAESKEGAVAAALGALAFAVHPVCVEPVAWVSGRFDTLMSSFVLGTCLVALGGEQTRKRLVLMFVLFFAAMCSKEAAIGLPVALPLLLLLKWRLKGEEVELREMARRLAPLLAVLALGATLYVAMRLAVIRQLFAGEETGVTFASGSILDKLNVASLAVTAFAKLLVNPWSHSAPLHPFSYEAGSGLQANTLVVLASVLVLLALATLKKPRMNFSLVLLAALVMGWPVLHIISIPQANGGNIVSDRYALAPLALLLAGLAAVTGAWLARRAPVMEAGEKRALVYAGVFVLMWAGAQAAHTNVTIPMWRNEQVLWAFAHRQVPDSIYAHKQYIGSLLSQGYFGEAEEEIERMWRQYPSGVRMTIGDIVALTIVRYKRGNYEEALEWARLIEDDKEKLQELTPRRKGAFYSVRGAMEGDAGHWELALHYMALAVQEAPSDLDNLFQYAHALFMNGQQEKADEVFGRALASSTKDKAVWALEWRKTTWQRPASAGAGAARSKAGE